MRRGVKDIKIVDKRHSTIDKEKSDPKKGLLVFRGEPKYVSVSEEQMIKEEAKYRPEHKLKWVSAVTQQGRDLQQWKYAYGFTEVTINDPYYPVGVEYNAQGNFQYMDNILMKCPLQKWLERRIANMKRANRARQARTREFKESLGEAQIGDATLQELLGAETEIG